MNSREDVFLQNGNRVLKETYMEIETVSMYQKNDRALKSSNIMLDKIRF